MLACDHGFIMGPTSGLERIDLNIVPLMEYADCLMCTRGILQSVIPANTKTPICLRSDAGTSILTDLNDNVLIDVEDAIRMNVSAMAVMLAIGDEATLNQLEDQVTVVNDDLKNLLDHAPRSQVDLILCNPPYFKATETSKKNLSEHYLLARHEITTNLEEICQVARHALKSNGRIAVVHRPDRFLDIIDTMRQYNLAPKRIQFIYPKVGREANMLLIEAIKDGSTDGLKILPPLFVHKENGDYTDEIFEIYFGKKAESES